MLEDAYCRRGCGTRLLSAQELIDCSDDWGNDGCNGGGWYDYGWDYVHDMKGIAREKRYPYFGVASTFTAFTILRARHDGYRAGEAIPVHRRGEYIHCFYNIEATYRNSVRMDTSQSNTLVSRVDLRHRKHRPIYNHWNILNVIVVLLNRT